MRRRALATKWHSGRPRILLEGFVPYITDLPGTIVRLTPVEQLPGVNLEPAVMTVRRDARRNGAQRAASWKPVWALQGHDTDDTASLPVVGAWWAAGTEQAGTTWYRTAAGSPMTCTIWRSTVSCGSAWYRPDWHRVVSYSAGSGFRLLIIGPFGGLRASRVCPQFAVLPGLPHEREAHQCGDPY